MLLVSISNLATSKLQVLINRAFRMQIPETTIFTPLDFMATAGGCRGSPVIPCRSRHGLLWLSVYLLPMSVFWRGLMPPMFFWRMTAASHQFILSRLFLFVMLFIRSKIVTLSTIKFCLSFPRQKQFFCFHYSDFSVLRLKETGCP